jgi:pilus assembly protein CpaD
VNRRFFRKDATMRSKIALLLLASALGGCAAGQAGNEGNLDRGMAPVNVPVVARTDFVFDAAAPNGSLLRGESARLHAWFAGLDLGYGDTIYVDGPFAESARSDVARVAGSYGLMVSASAPVTVGAVPPGMVRVIVSRTRASVPGCPNWNIRSQPNYENRMMSNLGCAVNSNLASMVANPEDLVHGREGTGVGDTRTAIKAVDAYRKAEPTGTKGLKEIDTKKGN